MNLKTRFVRSWGQLGMKYKLSEIMDIIGGGTPKTSKPEYWNGNIPWLSVKDFNNDYRYVYETEKTITQAGLDNSSTKMLKRNDSIISARGTVGEIAMIPFPMAFNQSCYGLRAKEDIVDAEYLYYLIKHNVVVLKKNTHGSVFDTITRDTFDGIEVELPSLMEQKVVASILRDLDDKIEVNNEVNKNLEQQIQELYKEWFITNREANWQRIPLSDIIFFQEGPGIRNWQYVEDGVKFINIRCINNGLIDTSTANKISLEEASGKYSHFMLEPYDIVMSCSGTLGRYAIVLPQNLPLCLNTSVIRFRPKQYKDDYSFVYGYMTSKEFLNQQITMANGSAQVNFGPTHLKKIEIVEPPVETRKKFNDLVFPLIETQISLRAENTRLVEIRDTLLPCLMSGEIDVSEVEI